jgi:cyclopropane fatty-acyl-phospholipid synthase-like methyltransferase
LPPDSRVLEIGCHQGDVSLYLARQGMRVVGLDINPAAVEVAWSNAVRAGVKDRVHFEAADILEDRDFGRYDLVILIRVLTCFPEAADWNCALDRARAHIRPQGLLYIHDFMFSPQNENYRLRYEEGQRLGWRPGNFAVKDKNGQPLFIAHHHCQEEVEIISRPYETILFDIHESLSLNGNTCTMFEFLGRKRTEAESIG